MADNLDNSTERRFPRPMRNEWGEGQGEGFPNKNGLLSPTLSSIVPLEEREQAPLAFGEEFCFTPVRAPTENFALEDGRTIILRWN